MLAIHDLNIASMYCDQLVAVKNGAVVGSGTPATLLTSDFIEMVYEVKAEILQRKNGQPYILFHSKGEDAL